MKLTATHQGITFTRSTERAYQFIVVAKRDEALRRSQGYFGRSVEESTKIFDEQKAKGEFDKFNAYGWCSRRDLADKLAQECCKKGLIEIAIVTVNPYL
jgi:hypothetical protein